MRTILLVAGLTACGVSKVGPDVLMFEVHRIDVGHPTASVMILDQNGDGFLDLVVTGGGNLTVLVRNAEGAFEVRKTLPAGENPVDFAAGDINRDGRGSFGPSENIDVGGDPYRGMTLADLNGDGHLDVVTPNPQAVAIQVGDGTGGFSSVSELDSRAMPPFNTTVGDFDGDGILDMAAGSGEAAGRIMVWLGMGDASFRPDPNAPYVIADGPTKLDTGDMNGDGLDDLLVASYLGDEVAIALGGEGKLRVVRIGLDDNPWDIAAGDLNGDGRMDLATANDGGNRIAVLFAREE